MRDVQMTAGLACQANVALDYTGLGFDGHPAKSESKGSGTEIHGAAAGEASVFRVLNHRDSELCGGLKTGPHDVIMENRLAVVSEADRAGIFQCRKICESHAQTASCGRCDGENVHDCAAIWGLYPKVDLRTVIHWDGVGHATNGCESSGCGRSCSGGDGFFVFLSRLAQVDVDIDQAGRHDEAGGIKDFR